MLSQCGGRGRGGAGGHCWSWGSGLREPSPEVLREVETITDPDLQEHCCCPGPVLPMMTSLC